MKARFQIDFERLITDILPPKKRRIVRVRFLFAQLAWIRKIHEEFLILIDAIIYQSNVTSQVIIFESYLVDEFGSGITITPNSLDGKEAFLADDNDGEFGFFIIDDEEILGGSYISNDTISDVNFIVNIPAGLNIDMKRLRALINKYKVPGSIYSINEIS